MIKRSKSRIVSKTVRLEWVRLIAVPVMIFVAWAVVSGCSPEFLAQKKKASTTTTTVTCGTLNRIEITNPGTVTGCTNFTLTITAKDACGNVLDTYAGAATWTTGTGNAITPATPNAFVAGVSVTNNVQIAAPGTSETIAVTTGAVSGTSTSFTVDGTTTSFAGIGWANVRLDRTYDLFWSPAYGLCGGYTSATRYDSFDANASTGQNFASPTYSVVATSFETQAFPDPGVSGTKYLVTRAVSGSATETNTNELPVRFDDGAVSTVAGGRHMHNISALSAGVHPFSSEVDSYGNIFMVLETGNSIANYGSNGGGQTVLVVMCVAQQGVCRGRTLGNVYVMAGVGASSDASLSDYTHAQRFSNSGWNKIRRDSAGNLVLTDASSRMHVVCLNQSGLCASTDGLLSIDHSGAGTAGVVGRIYKASGSLGGTPIDMKFDSHDNMIYSMNGSLIRVLCRSVLGWCANVAGGNVVAAGVPATLGTSYTIAGGGASAAEGVDASTSLLSIGGMTVDSSDNIILSDANGTDRVRVICYSGGGGMCGRIAGGTQVAAAGVAGTFQFIYLVAGAGGGYVDGAIASSTLINYAGSMDLDSSGNVVFYENGTSVLRVICNSITGLCAHVSGGDIATVGGAGTLGNIYRLAGTAASFGYAGDGGSAMSATLGQSAAYSYRTNVTVETTSNRNNVLVTWGGYGALNETFASAVRRASIGRIICMSATGACANTSGGTITPGSGSAATLGNIYRFAGDTSAAILADGIEAQKADLNGPKHIALDLLGNYIVSGHTSNKVNVICSTTGAGLCSSVSGANVATAGAAGSANYIYTLAGTGFSVNSGDGGPAASAGLYGPNASAVDTFGNIVIATPAYHTVRVVCMSPGNGVCPATDAGGTSIVPGGGFGVTAGYIYKLAGTGGSYIGAIGDGAVATAARFSRPESVVIDSNNNVIILDSNNARLRIVCMNALGPYCSSVAAGNVVAAGGAATAGFIYTLLGDGNDATAGDGGVVSSAQMRQQMNGLAIDSNNNVAFGGHQHYAVRVVCGSSLGMCSSAVGATLAAGGVAATARQVYRLAGDYTGAASYSGDGGAAISATYGRIDGLSFDSLGNLLIADLGNQMIRVVCYATGSGICSVVNGARIDPAGAPGVAFRTYAVIGTSASANFKGDGHLITDTPNVLLNYPSHAVTDLAGRIVVSDQVNNRVRMIWQ